MSIEQLIDNLQLHALQISNRAKSNAIKLLLCHVIKLDHAQLISHNDYQLTALELAQFKQLLAQLEDGVPVDYLLGYSQFYGRQFIVNEHTLIPRPETELLIELIIKLTVIDSPGTSNYNASKNAGNNSHFANATHSANAGCGLLDLGTGSGVIAVTCALENPQLMVSACDIAPETLQVAIKNAQLHNAKVNFFLSNWFDKLQGGVDKFAIIVANPPYIAIDDAHLNALKHEPEIALTDYADGLQCLRQIIAQARFYLHVGGYLLVEHGYNQGALVRELFASNNFTQITTLCDYSGIERLSYGRITT